MAAEYIVVAGDPASTASKVINVAGVAVTAEDAEDVEDRILALRAETAYREGSMELRSYAEFRARRLNRK